MFITRVLWPASFVGLFATSALGAELPKVTHVERQPLAAQVQRVIKALDFIGSPLPEGERKALQEALAKKSDADAVAAIQTILDPYCLARVVIATEKKLITQVGPAQPLLAEQGWRVFLVKVDNPSGLAQAELRPESPNALPLYQRSAGKPDPRVNSIGEVSNRFLDLMMFNGQPLVRGLAGLELEYRILQIYCRDAGRKEIGIGFGLWRDDKWRVHHQNEIAVSKQIKLFAESAPAVLVRLEIRDDDGQPTTASFVFKDSRGRVYPAMSRRLAPDLGFHPQIYRHTGETVALQPGQYTVEFTRGPEYLPQRQQISVVDGAVKTERFQLKRWVHPAVKGWYSGDHHVHAAGCSHYESPTEGIAPSDMIRHILGEDLNVGCCLSWGPCWYHQKRYFEGKINALSTPANLLRYDVEVSGFPSSHCGHICLLRLRDQDYPGSKIIEDWPSWDLPIFRWAKSQNAVVGFAHSGWGLDVGPTKELPNYIVPPMSGIGANEYLVDIAHGMCDFISTVDTPPVWELNIWYHTLNCGYRCRISGETDFPCIYGERVGLGRSYVHLDGPLNFDNWAEGIRQGRCYVSDGKSHLMDFAVNATEVGLNHSEVTLTQPGVVQVKAKVAALLETEPNEQTEHIRKTPLNAKPYWDIERARLGTSRRVRVELVLNGRAVQEKEIIADGKEQPVTFDLPVKQSSWIALRIFPSSHTNPIFVLVGDKPIRTSKRSAEWCLKSIDQCWQQKVRGIRPGQEQQEARVAYDKARREYQKILSEAMPELEESGGAAEEP